MAKKSSTSDTEKLDDKHLEHVIKMLNPSDGIKPWTKKECCEYLGITYNTTRLGNLIEKYKERKLQEEARKAEKRGKPATEAEKSYIVSSYLEGATLDSIAKALYRSSLFVKAILETLQVPIRQSAHSYFNPNLVPEAACKDKFLPGELVYSMRYDSLAKVMHAYTPGVYSIYLINDKWKCYAYQPNYELASLDHIKHYITI